MAGEFKKDTTLRVDEDLTIFNAEALREKFSASLTEDGPVLLDLSMVGEMDTAGFQLLVALKNAVDAAGRDFRITALSQATLSVLKLYNMTSYFGLDAGSLGIVGFDDEDADIQPRTEDAG